MGSYSDFTSVCRGFNSISKWNCHTFPDCVWKYSRQSTVLCNFFVNYMYCT